MTKAPSHQRKNQRTGKAAPKPAPAGLAARLLAVRLIASVLKDARSLDDSLATSFARTDVAALEPRDRALAYLITTTVLRRHGELTAVVSHCLDKALPSKRGTAMEILLAGAAQLLFLKTPPHAAISLAVTQCRTDRQAQRFDGLINAVLRRITREGEAVLAELDAVRSNIPAWLWQRWSTTYGEATARKISEASLAEAALDLTVRERPSHWADALGGIVLPTGSLRLKAEGRIDALAGYDDGAWWVQDAAAALPARLFGDVAGRRIVDLCAAPGGKTAQLAAAGARVTAVESVPTRIERLKANLERLQLKADIVAADATEFRTDDLYDAVLLDAPCTSTGTIRRHPDILHLKRPDDIAKLAARQTALLDAAANLVRPGGMLVYCTCSLEPEEGEQQVSRFIANNGHFKRRPISADELGAPADWFTPDGDLRTLPFYLPMQDTNDSNAMPGNNSSAMPGIDGFYAARLVRAD